MAVDLLFLFLTSIMFVAALVALLSRKERTLAVRPRVYLQLGIMSILYVAFFLWRAYGLAIVEDVPEAELIPLAVSTSFMSTTALIMFILNARARRRDGESRTPEETAS